MAFYEIDPEIVSMAEDPRLFTYLRDSRPPSPPWSGTVGFGSRRHRTGRTTSSCSTPSAPMPCPCTCSRRRPSTSTPSKLSPGGAIMVHVSNRYLDLEPVVAASADHLGWTAVGEAGNRGCAARRRLQLGHGHGERQQHRSAAESARVAAGRPGSPQLDRRLLVRTGGPPRLVTYWPARPRGILQPRFRISNRRAAVLHPQALGVSSRRCRSRTSASRAMTRTPKATRVAT